MSFTARDQIRRTLVARACPTLTDKRRLRVWIMARVLNLPSGFCQASIRFTGAPLPSGAVCTLGLSHSDIVGATPASVAASLSTALTASGRPFSSGSNLSAAITLASILVKFGPMATGPSAELAVGTAIGAGGVDTPPPNTAVLIAKNTALGGKRGKGHMFHPGLIETQVTSAGAVDPAQVTGMQLKWNSLWTQLDSIALRPVLLHSYDPDAGESPIAPTPITSFTVQATVASQRQRLRR